MRTVLTTLQQWWNRLLEAERRTALREAQRNSVK